MRVDPQPPYQSVLLSAAESGADAETALMIHAARQAQESRKLHKEQQQDALKEQVRLLQRSAQSLRQEASRVRVSAAVSLLSGLSSVTGGVLGGVMGSEGSAMSRVAKGAELGGHVGKTIQGTYGVVVGGFEERLAAERKDTEAQAKQAEERLAHHRDSADDAKRINDAVKQHLQRHLELKHRGVEIAQQR